MAEPAVEEDQVTECELRLGHGTPDPVLGLRGPRQGHSGSPPGGICQAGAVIGVRTGGGELVRLPELSLGEGERRCSATAAGRGRYRFPRVTPRAGLGAGPRRGLRPRGGAVVAGLLRLLAG